MNERDALIAIGNLVGAPTTQYSPEIQRRELLDRIETISKIVQDGLGVPCPRYPAVNKIPRRAK